MSFPFKELPGTSGDYLRPAVPVTVEGIARAPQLCLQEGFFRWFDVRVRAAIYQVDIEPEAWA